MLIMCHLDYLTHLVLTFLQSLTHLLPVAFQTRDQILVEVLSLHKIGETTFANFLIEYTLFSLEVIVSFCRIMCE